MKLRSVELPPRLPGLDRILVLFHGFGADEHDLLPIGHELDPRLRVISLQAPIALDFGGRAWFNLQQTPRGFAFDPAEVAEGSRLALDAVEEIARRSPRPLLGGFSQGAGMALSVALPRPDLASGVLVLSGVPPRAEQPVTPGALRGLPAFVAHGVHGPGAEWASTTQPGDRINGVGPRGKIYLDPSADWHLFVGDDTAGPASLNMLEALPAGVPGLTYLEVSSAEDELSTSSTQQVNWLHRGETQASSSDLLVDAMNSVELPAGRGHVYIAGEVQIVAAVQRAALARGLAPDQLSPKAYWGRGKSNANTGDCIERITRSTSAIASKAPARRACNVDASRFISSARSPRKACRRAATC